MVELACLRGIHVIEGKHNLIKRPIQNSFCKLKNTKLHISLFVQPANKRKVLSPMMFTLMSLSSLPWAFRTITWRTRSIKVLEEKQKCKQRQLLSTKQG